MVKKVTPKNNKNPHTPVREEGRFTKYGKDYGQNCSTCKDTEDLCIRVLKSTADLPIHGITEILECRAQEQCEEGMVEEVHSGESVQRRCGLCHSYESTDMGGIRSPGRILQIRLMDCKECHERFRADKLIEDYMADNGIEIERFH